MLKLKQCLCRHDFILIAEHNSTSQNLWQCSKCDLYYIQHWGLGIGYNCKKPNINGWVKPYQQKGSKTKGGVYNGECGDG